MNLYDFIIFAIVIIAAIYVVYTICDTIVQVKKIEYDYFKKLYSGVSTEEEENEKISDVEA